MSHSRENRRELTACLNVALGAQLAGRGSLGPLGISQSSGGFSWGRERGGQLAGVAFGQGLCWVGQAHQELEGFH